MPEALAGRPRPPKRGAACLVLACSVAATTAAATALDAPAADRQAPEVRRLSDLEREIPMDATRPATVTEVARGERSSVNLWQIRQAMPAHLHERHEEVIVVESGSVEARIGERTVRLGPGDLLFVPRGMVHGGHVVEPGPARGYSIFAPAFEGEDRVPVAEPTVALDVPPRAQPAGPGR